MPHLLLVTIIRIGSGLAGRDDQIRQVEKSPSAVPASPPVTMVMPRPPARLFAMAVPGAIEYCTSIGLETGTTFHSLIEKCPTKFRPPEKGSVAVFFICLIASTGSVPIARSVEYCR